jgi:type IV pilus assembly protein PilC
VSQLTRPPTLPELLARATTDDAPVEPPAKPRSWNLELTAKKVKPVELMNLSRQMASFLRAGVPVLDALAIIRDESSRGRLGPVLDEVSQALRSGSTLSDAVAVHRDFPNYYVAMLRAAELTGRLDLVFDQLAIYIERDLETRRRIRSAMTYPSVVVLLALVSIAVLVVFVLPKFEVFFADLGAELPLPTRVLLGGVRLLTDLAPLLAGGFVVWPCPRSGPWSATPSWSASAARWPPWSRRACLCPTPSRSPRTEPATACTPRPCAPPGRA